MIWPLDGQAEAVGSFEFLGVRAFSFGGRMPATDATHYVNNGGLSMSSRSILSAGFFLLLGLILGSYIQPTTAQVPPQFPPPGPVGRYQGWAQGDTRYLFDTATGKTRINNAGSDKWANAIEGLF
jgi:hypothetical protein